MPTVTTTSVVDQIRNAFPFEVDKLPLSGPEGLRTPHYGLFRGDTGQCVGVSVKRGYVPHTVDDICALAEAASSSFDGQGTVAASHWRDGHRVIVSPSNAYRRSIFGTVDNVFPRLIIRAGYDGRAFQGTLGFYRDLCSNLQMLQSASGGVSAKIRHTHHLRDRLSELRDTFSRLVSRWSGVVDTARALDQRTVDLAEFIRTVDPLADGASRQTQNSYARRAESIVRRVMREQQLSGREVSPDHVTAWQALNGVQGYVQHVQNRHGRPSAVARSLLALDDPAVSRAVELALAV